MVKLIDFFLFSAFYTGSTQNGNSDASGTIHVTSRLQRNPLPSDSSSSNESSEETGAEEISDGDSVHSIDLISDEPITSNSDQRAVAQGDENSDDADGNMGSPIFSSTHVASNFVLGNQPPSSLKKAETFVQTLYDSITVSEYASNDEGASKGATEVGTIEELPDRLIGAETNENSGPAYDIQILRRLMTANKVPQLLPFLCLDATEMRMQSHADCSPVMLIRFHPTQETASILRSLIAALPLLPQLLKCNIHVAVMGSEFDQMAFGKQKQLNKKSDVQFHVLHPTLSSTRMVVGNILTGNENDFLRQLNQAIEEACQAADTVKEHREMLQQDRELRKQQEEEYLRSQEEDRRKRRIQEKDANKKEADEKFPDEVETDGEEGEISQEDTVFDPEELRKKRLAAFDQQREATKRQREDNEDDDSGTITFKM